MIRGIFLQDYMYLYFVLCRMYSEAKSQVWFNSTCTFSNQAELDRESRKYVCIGLWVGNLAIRKFVIEAVT